MTKKQKHVFNRILDVMIVCSVFVGYAWTVYAAGNDSNTVLLIQSDTTNGSTTFIDTSVGGATHVITPIGDAQHSTAKAQFGASSMYFDGTGDRLEVPAHADWNFGTGDFTIDFWVNPSVTVNDRGLVGVRKTSGNDANEWAVLFYAQANRVEWGNGVAVLLDSGAAVAQDAWTHVAVVRNAGTLKIYYDGVEQASMTDNGDYNDAGALTVGEDLHPAGGPPFNGFMDEVRISKGIARWTADFVPPVGAYTAPNVAPTATGVGILGTEQVGETLTGSYTYNDADGDLEGDTTFRWLRSDTVDGTYTAITVPDPNIKLLIHGDGTGQTFTDESASAHTITTNGDATQSTTQSQFGGSALYFDGVGDYLSIPDSEDWNFTASDGTIDFWIYPTSLASTVREALINS